jgi:hypothetical protein
MKAAAPSVFKEPLAACIAYHTWDSEGQAGYSEERQGMKGHMCMEPHEDRGRTEVISGCITFCVHIELVMLLVVSRMYS